MSKRKQVTVPMEKIKEQDKYMKEKILFYTNIWMSNE